MVRNAGRMMLDGGGDVEPTPTPTPTPAVDTAAAAAAAKAAADAALDAAEKERIRAMQGVTPGAVATPAPAPAPAPTPAPAPASTSTPTYSAADVRGATYAAQAAAAYLKDHPEVTSVSFTPLQVQIITGIAVQDAIESGAVVDSGKGEQPDEDAVAQVITDAVKEIVKIIAPDAPEDIVVNIVPIITEEIIDNPEIIKSGTGETPSTDTIENITNAALDTYYTEIVGDTGLTAAQIDTRAVGEALAADTGQVFDANTGLIYPAGTSQDVIKEAADATAALRDAEAAQVLSPATQAALQAADEVNTLAGTKTQYSESEWARRQSNLPEEDRMSYSDYLASINKPTAPASVTTPTSTTGISGGKPDELLLGGQGTGTTNAVTPTPEPGMTSTGVPPTPVVAKAPTDFSSAEAEQYYNVLKGRATAGVKQTPEEDAWLKGYQTNRYETLKGKAVQGLELTPAEQAESDFYINLGIGGTPPPGETPPVEPPPGETPPDETEKPVGTPPAYVYNENTKTWEEPPKPTAPGNWTWDNLKGWVDTTVTPGSTGTAAGSERTLAKDTFKNTLALFFGPSEVSKPWVDGLYKSVSGFYNSGSTIEESLNLSIQDVRNNPDMAEFAKRFKGVYALTDRLAGGEAISVPTIAEYFKSEAAMGDTLREAGLGDLATQDFLGDIIGRGKSVLEVGNLITDTFATIDNAPKELKDTLSTYFPSVDRVSLAKALLTGKEGAVELDKKIKGISVLSAAKSQGVGIDLATGLDIAAMGQTYGSAMEGFGTVKKLERANVLASFGGEQFTQKQAQDVVFGRKAQEEEKLRLLSEKEKARFSGSSGLAASALRASSSAAKI